MTPLDKMTPSSMPFATEISPPIQQPNCAQAPATFDPATASKATLMQYGLPSREKNESQVSWLKKVGWMKHRVCVYYQTNGPKHATLTGTTSGYKNAQTYRDVAHTPQEITNGWWSGNIADQTCGISCANGSYTYTEIDSDWYIPCIQQNSSDLYDGGDSSAWVGLGGTNPNEYELVQAGSESDQYGVNPNYTDNYNL